LRLINGALLGVLFLTLVVPVSAQRRATSAHRSKSKPAPTALEAAHEKAKQELTKATEEYKKSLRELLVMRQKSVKRAEEEAANVRQLYTEGLVSKKELENKEAAVASERAKIDEANRDLKSADVMLEQTLAEADVAIELARSPSATSGIVERTAYFRFNGNSAWSLTRAGSIQDFFFSKFHRTLPISAFGQSSFHSQLGFDHSNAMDVGINPDSPEGKALVAYLESSGIPFIAFRRAVLGAASGPHIHIGRPSHKL
jgi:hypothetical protein